MLKEPLRLHRQRSGRVFGELFTASSTATYLTATFIALRGTDEGEAESVTPAKRRQVRDMHRESRHLVIMLTSCGLTLFDNCD